MPSSYALGDHFEEFIRAQVESGRYGTATEVVRDALRLLEEEQGLRALQVDELRSMIREGAVSGAGVPLATALARVRSRARRVIDHSQHPE